ncbi:MAG: hypothetical protein KGN30_14810 [Nitrospirota bacterium]|nr:hypothetical protein [Nitrospirota bacterium]
MLRRMPGWRQVLISLLVAGLGWFAAQALQQVDRDLRILYTEYTVAATDLAHVLADVMRYRTTIIRALEAPSQRDFERITASLPHQRALVERTIDRFAEASRGADGRQDDAPELLAVRESLAVYFAAADRTMTLLQERWRATSAADAAERQSLAERHVADTAGPKLVQVTLAIDRLLDTVAMVGKDMRDAGTGVIRKLSLALWLGSLAIAGFNLLVGIRASVSTAASSAEPQLAATHQREEPGTSLGA